MKPNTLLSRSLADSLLEIVQACQNKQRINNPNSVKHLAMLWFETLNDEMLVDILISHEHEWLTVICDMVIESRRTLRGDENLYALDEEFPNQRSGKKNVMSFHRR